MDVVYRVGWQQLLRNRKRAIDNDYANIIQYLEKNEGCMYG